jgi:signal transduction histidine kinase
VRAAGYDPLEAWDGSEALRLLHVGAADVALLDTQLPDPGALDVLEQSRGAARAVPVLLLAGPGRIPEAVQAMKLGARNYLSRPLTGPELSEALREALQSRPPLPPAPERDEQLRQAVKMEAVGRLAGGVAHDFNNLLTVIIGYSEMLRHGLAADHPLRTCTEEIVRAAQRGASLTQQLLAFSRKQVLQPTVLDLNQVVARMEKLLRPLIGEHVELALQLSAETCAVKADNGQLEQVIVNLAVNARDAMPAGGRLTLRTGLLTAEADDPVPPGRWAVLTVSDTGVGMDEATRLRIFEPFFTTKEAGRGTGLGLATVHGIVQQSGGHVTAVSELGHGSTFTVYLPQAWDALRAPDAAPAAAPHPRGSETVLLVEDEPSVRGMVRAMLHRLGYTVLEAPGGEEAQKLAGQHPGPIHLLITDVVMPRLSGVEVARRLVQIRPGLRVLYISGYTEGPLLRQALAEGIADALPKPFAAGPLAHKVREVLDRKP